MATQKHDSQVVTMKTRIAENEPQAETSLTIVWDDEAAARSFAIRAVKVAAQALMRAAGDIPAEFTVSVSELAKRERGGFAAKPSANNAKRMMAKLDDAEYRAALLAIGLNVREADRLVAARKVNAAMSAPVGNEARAAARKPSAPVITKPTRNK
jgi:hypothetical protein